ncbi:MAG: putative Na+-dependent transporter [Myxococcota bacterium]|jgi:predicted Na+-dependent transporter
MSQRDQLRLSIFWILTMFGMGATLSSSDLARVMRCPA